MSAYGSDFLVAPSLPLDGTPLRGNNPKDIWGFPHLEGTEKSRVKAANKLLLRMHDLMRTCGKLGVPFYLENPQQSTLWRHPLISKWARHPHTTKEEFDYCQSGTDFEKADVSTLL